MFDSTDTFIANYRAFLEAAMASDFDDKVFDDLYHELNERAATQFNDDM